VKFLYCPKCKEMRAKAWFQMRPQCSRCLGPATQIVVPGGPLTYLTYVLYFVVPGLVAVSLIIDERVYLYYALAGLAVMMIGAMIDLGRGQRIAKSKVKVASSDLHEFRRRGWL